MSARWGFRLQAVALGLFLAACATVFVLFWRFAGGDVNPLDHPYKVQAVVPSAVALAGNADVRQAGVRIGKVTGIADRGTTAVLELQLDGAHAPAYRNARVLVRTKTLSGENYVDLDPGSPQAGAVPSGGVLGIDHAGQAVQLDDILSSLDAPRRRSLQRVLDGLGAGLGGHGAYLNRFLGGTADTMRDGATVTEVLGADRKSLAALTDDVGHVMQAIGDRGEAVATLARGARRLATAVAARERDLRATLAALPGFLAQTRDTTTALGSFSDEATPVVRDLADATSTLVPAVTQLRPTAERARRAVGALQGFARRALPLVERLAPFARTATRVAAPLEATLRELNPLLRHLAPYGRDAAAFMATTRAVNETTDALGHYARVIPLVSKSNLFGVLTPEQEKTLQALFANGIVKNLDERGRNPYPKPGQAFRPLPFDGHYPHVEPDPPYSP
jgi:phospholipid/cholesterol/gamma-HCH transport system substrate-binding protein